MFGNLPGWIIAVVLAISTTSLIWWKGRPGDPEISQPTGALKVMLAKVSMTPEPSGVLPATGEQDAAVFYREAAARVESKKQTYRAYDNDETRKPAKPASAKALQADVDLLVKAAECGRMNLFASSPGEVVNYTQYNRKPILQSLQLLSNVALDLAMEYKAKNDYASARKYRQAVYMLGRFLYEERQAWVEYELGLRLMEDSTFMLAGIPGIEPATADQLKQINDQCTEKRKELIKLVHQSMYAIGNAQKDAVKLPMVGDVFEVATKSQEPFWQAQAVLRLGVLQRSAGVSGNDQFHCRKLLNELDARTDLKPNVKAAVAAAKTLVNKENATPDEKLATESAFNMAGGNY